MKLLRTLFFELLVPMACSIPWAIAAAFVWEAFNLGRWLEGTIYAGVTLWLFSWCFRAAEAVARWRRYP